MAHINLTLQPSDGVCTGRRDGVVDVGRSLTWACWISGRADTFCMVRDGEDAIGAVGYVCHPDMPSMRLTLMHLLRTFEEESIRSYKQQLIGQYALLVQRSRRAFLFTDLIGGRSVFYSKADLSVSTSFAQLEDSIGVASNDLDPYKVLEFLAMRHVLYPAWLGRGTCHRRINWLMPYEYLVIDLESRILSVRCLVYTLENRKVFDCATLADELLSSLRVSTSLPEFRDSKVAATLTGGHDSRLVAAVAAQECPHVRFRIAVALDKPRTLMDLAVAKKLARIRGIPLDVYEFNGAGDEDRFRALTEGFSPTFNRTIAPLLAQAGTYALGFDGAFGTELYLPIAARGIEDYICRSLEQAQRFLKADRKFWHRFHDALHEQMRALREQFQMTIDDERDCIRLFMMLDTARYASFLLSAYNESGYECSPYGSWSVLANAMRVAAELWGDHRSFRGNSLVQKAAMAKVDVRMGSVLTYMHCRPMLPLSSATFPKYLAGCALQAARWIKGKCDNPGQGAGEYRFLGATYRSDGWESVFLERTARKYGVHRERVESVL